MPIRAATAADVGAIVSLVEAAYAPYVPRIGRQPAPMTADYPALVAAGHVWVLAEPDVVGVLVTVAAADHLLVENVAVAPAAHGHGYGRALLAHAEHQARTLRLPQLRLYTNAAMTENLAFYPRLGYLEVARSEQDGFDRVFFVKDVEPPRDGR